MIFRTKHLVNTFLYLIQGPKFYGGSPSGQSSTVTQATIPDQLTPYIKSYMTAAESQLYQKNANGEITGIQPYKAYGGTYDAAGNQTAYDPSKGIADFSPIQKQAQQEAGALQAPTAAFDSASNMAKTAGAGQLESAQLANAYGQLGSSIGNQAESQAVNQGGVQISQAQQAGQGAYGMGAANNQSAISNTNNQIQNAGAYGAQGSAIGANAASTSANQTSNQIGQAANYGAVGQGMGIAGASMGAAAAGQAGQGYNAQANFAQQATDPNAVGAYMSPYMQGVVNQQVNAANRQYDITGAQEMGNATQSHAFGGSREALMAAENERSRNSAIGAIQANGLQDAFSNAQSQQQFGANLGIQGLNAGNAAMQTGIQGADAGISGANTGLSGGSAQTAATNAGISGANTGIAGANTGLAGVGAQTTATDAATNAASTGISGANAQISGVGAQTAASNMERSAADTALTGNAQGLAGVNAAQAGYAGANQSATTTGNLATQGLAAQVSTIDAKQQAGQQITAREQSILDLAVQDYGNEQNNALNKIGTMSDLVHGINTSSSVSYGPLPSVLSQVGGLAATAGGAYLAGKANGGIIKDNSYAGGGSVEGSMRGKLEDLDSTHLQEIIKTNSSSEMAKIAKDVLASKYAKGGIVAFAGEDGSLVNDPVYNARLKKEPTGIQQAQQAPVDPMANLQAASSAAQKEADIPIADRIQQQKTLENKFVGADTETAADRKSIMDERANAPDEARRQMGMRLMEFGANWASTPGAPLVAGMKALTSTLPGIMSDSKDNKKMMKDLDNSEYLLNHATRLEKLGQLKEATAAKDKASELVMKHQESLVTYGLKKQEIDQQAIIAREKNVSSEKQQAMQSGAQLAGQQIAANVSGSAAKYPMNQQQHNALARYNLRATELAKLVDDGMDKDKNGKETPEYTAKKLEASEANTAYEALNREPKTPAELEQEKFMARRKGEQK